VLRHHPRHRSLIRGLPTIDVVHHTTGLRERKKAATRRALHEAALRLAAERGLEHLTVEAIAEAAAVSRRTFSNYFSGKEEALFYDDAVRLRRLLQFVQDQPAGRHPWRVLTSAAERLVADEYRNPDPSWLSRRRRLHAHPSVAAHEIAVYTGIERELAVEVARRLTGVDVILRADVMAGTFLTALRVAVHHWMNDHARSLADTVRAALVAAAPAARP
jgi:AcrR family transcriptional regulator